MASKIKENKNMAPSALLREEGDSSEHDNQLKRYENNRAVGRRRVNSRVRKQRALRRRLNQLRAEQKMLEEKEQILVKKLRSLKNLILAIAAETSQIDLPKSVLN